MSSESRVNWLKISHGQLEEAIHKEQDKSAPDEVIIDQLKKKKLLIKDELLNMGLI